MTAKGRLLLAEARIAELESSLARATSFSQEISAYDANGGLIYRGVMPSGGYHVASLHAPAFAKRIEVLILDDQGQSVPLPDPFQVHADWVRAS